jgi:cell wall-associated NlpC family hydrolase
MNKHGICLQACVPIRHEASHRSEMTNQLLFGDTYQIITETDDWTCIRSLHDNYIGWIDNKNIEEIDKNDLSKYSHCEKQLSSELFSVVRFSEKSKTLTIPIGSYIAVKQSFNSNHLNYIYDAQCIHNTELSIQTMLEHAYKFLNTPYLWGGKTPMGMDCSGFTQVLFRFAGIHLQRDASQQIETGISVDLLHSHAGDLAFFGKNSKINHVGILISLDTIIHCSGKVRIDKIDTTGIFDTTQNIYTHYLQTVKHVEKI